MIFCSTLISEEEAINTYLTSETDNLSLVEGVVNACNGKLVQFDKDIQVNGADSLELIRYYDGGHNYKGVCGYGFGFSFPVILTFSNYDELKVEQRGGSFLPFDMTEKKKNYYKGTIDGHFLKHGYTNCCEGLLRGEKDVLAMSVKGGSSGIFAVNLGNGVNRYYSYDKVKDGLSIYRLVKEKRANGNLRHFEYGDKKNSESPTRIWTTNKNESLTLNWMNFKYGKKELKVTASNGEEVCYQISKKEGTAELVNSQGREKLPYKLNLLNKVTGKHLNTAEYDSHLRKSYKKAIFSIPQIKRPDGRSLSFEYDSNERVTIINLSHFKKPLYSFDYKDGYTVVVDGLKNSKRYDYNKDKRLVALTEPCRSHYYDWSKTGQLQTHSIKDAKTNKVTLQHYSYDSVGNITEAKVNGNITGQGSNDLYVVRYTHSQDGRNNVIKENHNHERKFIFDYAPDTNLVIRKLTFADQGFVEREFSDYDENAILIKKIVDDGSTPDASNLTGVSYRLITEIEPQLNPNLAGITLPKVIKEFYLDLKTGQQVLLKKVEKTYIQGDLLAEDKVFDANGNYCYSNLFEYNDRKELIKEVDAYGVATV